MSFLFVDVDRCPFCHRPTDGRFGLCRDCLDELEAPGACRLLTPDYSDEQNSPPVDDDVPFLDRVPIPDEMSLVDDSAFSDAMSVDDDVPYYAYSALFYNRFLRHFFGAYKFQQKTVYASVFQEILAAYVKQHPVLSQASWVSYIPQTHRREVLRGSHPAKALAESVASTLHLPLVSLLEKGMRHRAQKRISAWERRTNVKGAFSLSSSALNDPLVGVGIICDDFLTTGNTLFEAMQILNEVHWYAVGLTLACVDYPSQEESEGGWL